MLKRTDDGSSNVLAHEITGKLTEEEFETVSEEFKAAVAAHGKVRLLVRASEIPSVELGALAEDLKLAPYAADIERYAIVSDSTHIEWGRRSRRRSSAVKRSTSRTRATKKRNAGSDPNAIHPTLWKGGSPNFGRKVLGS